MTDSAASPKRRSPFTLRFSLRMLLAAFTAFAIGFPVWYRWPYQEEEPLYPNRNGQPDKTKVPFGRIVTSWQRQWGGGKLKHGPRAYFQNGSDQATLISNYRHGKQHGPELQYTADGRCNYATEYRNGDRIQEMIYRPDESIDFRVNWVEGELHTAEQHLPDGQAIRYRFTDGRVTHRNEQLFENALLAELASGRLDTVIAQRLADDAVHPDGATPQEQIEELGQYGRVPVVIEANMPLEWREPAIYPNGIDLASALVINARAAGWDCYHCNGCIWVLSERPDDDWRDPTGISEIQPPAGTALAAAWRQSIGPIGREDSIANRLEAIGTKFGIAMELPPAEPNREGGDPRILNVDSSFLELRHALTLLLYHSRCRCELRGETLVILPPDTVDGRR